MGSRRAGAKRAEQIKRRLDDEHRKIVPLTAKLSEARGRVLQKLLKFQRAFAATAAAEKRANGSCT
jgi:hypothetical protein